MSWNYRIVSEEAPEGEFYQLYAIYYDDGKIVGMTESPSRPYGDSFEELQADMNYMMAAFEKPILPMKHLDNVFEHLGELGEIDE